MTAVSAAGADRASVRTILPLIKGGFVILEALWRLSSKNL